VKQGELKHLLPQLLPGNQAVLFTVTHTPLPKWDDTDIVVQSLTTSERKVVVQHGADGRYVASGHLVYMQRGVLMAVPFDLRRLQANGGGIGVVADVMQAANMLNEDWDSGAGQFSVSDTGSLLYAPGGIFPDPERFLVWVDRSGRRGPAGACARVSVAAALTRWPANRGVDERRPQRLGLRPLTTLAEPSDVRTSKRARHLDTRWQTRGLRIG
jgi:hypothetical protein